MRGRQYGHATRRAGCQQNCLKQRPTLARGRVAGGRFAVQRVAIHPCVIRNSRPWQQRRSSRFRQSHAKALPCCCGGMDVHVLPYARGQKGCRQPILAILHALCGSFFGKIKVRYQCIILHGRWRVSHSCGALAPHGQGSVGNQIGLAPDGAGKMGI